jgi:prophage maintenance system killer protein
LKGGLNLSEIDQLRELLHQKADIQARIKLIPYDGAPEIKTQGDKQYLYVRKRIGGRNTSTYVDLYSETLYQLLLKNARERRELEKTLRRIDRKLLQLGYTEEDLDPQVQKNLDFARINMKSNIYDQAILEGVATSFPQTEEIIDNGIVNGMSADDVQKILNLKHAWEFILDKDVIQSKSDYYLLCHIAKQVNEGFFTDGGRIRGVPVTIGGCSYVPPLPIEMDVKDKISGIVSQTEEDAIDTAIRLCLYCMRTQIFLDGNKRSAVIFANHYLISKGKGIIIIPEKSVSDFKRLLVKYYESNDMNEISAFMKKECWKNFE